MKIFHGRVFVKIRFKKAYFNAKYKALFINNLLQHLNFIIISNK